MKKAIRILVLTFAMGILACGLAYAKHQNSVESKEENPTAGSQPQTGQAVDDETFEVTWEKMADSHSSNPALSAKLRVALKAFAKENSLSDEQLQRLLSDLGMTSIDLEKGGMGPIGRGTYVVLDGNRNSLVVGRSPRRKRWIGKSSSQPQLVVADGERVLGAFTTDDLAKLRILLFAPTEVRFIDLQDNWGGRFLRGKAN